MTKTHTTRAVLRPVDPANGNPEVYCVACKGPIKFVAQKRQRRVICNLFENGVWTDTVHFHSVCYFEAGQPYGEPAE